MPIALILLQHDPGSALVYLVFILPLFREGLSGGILIFGVLLLGLFITSLIVNKFLIILGVLVIALLAHIIVTKHIKSAFVGLLIFAASFGIQWKLQDFSSLSVDSYYALLISIGITAFFGFIYAARRKLTFIFILFPLLFATIGFTYSVNYVFNNVLQEHQQRRINVMLGRETDPLGSGYNVEQSKIAIGSGGLYGKGYLQGTQTKFDFVPEQSTDFIFCTVGEEWGFFGSFTVILLFVILFLRIIYLAERQRWVFSRIFGYCILSVFLMHVVINIGMTIGLVPVIGIPLTFISYGGSSLWGFTLMLFIFLRLDANRITVW